MSEKPCHPGCIQYYFFWGSMAMGRDVAARLCRSLCWGSGVRWWGHTKGMVREREGTILRTTTREDGWKYLGEWFLAGLSHNSVYFGLSSLAFGSVSIKVLGNQPQASKGSPLVESHRICLGPPARVVTRPVKWCLPWKLIETQCPGFLLGAGHRPFLNGMFQNSRLAEGNQKPHYSGIMSDLYQGTVGNLQKFKFPSSHQGLTLQVGFSKDSSQVCFANSFLHTLVLLFFLVSFLFFPF